tara:strand:- start:314 stop:2383 length:2070 start_codon:yes stop_codon:yes gene_type:complete
VSLEDIQRIHNRVITGIGNTSASNNFKQHKNDLNSKLIASAEAFAAGRTLGMSEEETLAAISRSLRKQKRADDRVSQDDIERRLIQSSKTLTDPANPAEIKGVSLREEPEVDPFGQDQGQYYEYREGDSQYTDQQRRNTLEAMADMEARDEMGQRVYDRYGVQLNNNVNPADYDELAAELETLRGTSASAGDRSPVAPQSALRDAVARLNAAESQQSGLMSKVRGLIGGNPEEIPGLVGIRGELEDELQAGKVQRDADSALSQEMVRRDNERFSGRRAGYSNVKAAMEAEDIGETMYRPSSTYPGIELPAVRADKTIAAIGAANPRQFPVAGFNDGGIALDPATGNPIGMQGMDIYTGPNTDSGSTLNAPMTTRAWMVEKQPGYREGGRMFGDFPQAGVTAATSLFADRIRGMEGAEEGSRPFSNVSPNIRSISELQRAADAVIADTPGPFYTKEVNPEGGRMISRKQQIPDIRGVLGKLRYTPAQEAELANAMYQLEVAQATEINQNGKGQYYTRTGPMGKLEPTGFGGTTPGGAKVFFNSPEAIDPRAGQAPVARMNPGQTIEGRDIVTAFKGLPSPGAQQPFIGQVADEPPRMNRFNSTGQTSPEGIEQALRQQEQEFAFKRQKTAAKKDPRTIVRPVEQQPVDESALRGKVVKAQLTQERANRDAKKRQAKQTEIMQYIPRRFRG